jgi:RHS repeat-associated protein
VDVIGSATNTATVTVNDQATYRKTNYYRIQLALTNASSAVWQSVTNLAVLNQGTTDVMLSGLTNNVFLPKTPESFIYDLPHEIGVIEGAALLKARVRCVPSQRFSRIISRGKDGNLTGDGRWIYTWDLAREIAAPSGSSGIRAPACTRKVGGQRCLISRAEENRLVSMTNNSGVPAGAQMGLAFTYDSKSRRISKSVIASGVTNTLNFVYDGRNLLAGLTNSSTLNESFTWGLDLSGSMQGSPRESGTSLTGGAGGVGGLLIVNQPSTQVAFVAYDGNGNVSALVSAANGTVLANYEYGPFGELIRATGPMAKLNPFRFSTKYQDDETDLLYYGLRYYNSQTGEWLSRDPLLEEAFGSLEASQLPHSDVDTGNNEYQFVKNCPTCLIDFCGGGIVCECNEGVNGPKVGDEFKDKINFSGRTTIGDESDMGDQYCTTAKLGQTIKVVNAVGCDSRALFWMCDCSKKVCFFKHIYTCQIGKVDAGRKGKPSWVLTSVTKEKDCFVDSPPTKKASK